MNDRVLYGICLAAIAVASLTLAVRDYRSTRAKPGLPEYRLACGLLAAGMATFNLLPVQIADGAVTLWMLGAVAVIVVLLFCRAGYLMWMTPKELSQ